MLFTTHMKPDGSKAVTVDNWGQEVLWAKEVLEQADPAMIRVEGDVIHVTVANGWARYQIVSRDDPRPIVARLLTSMIDGRE